ncbi:hypothetical protein A2U01_0012410, partial [Trifolium medium]|nr:hypothetical protein [Trifolium medium]
MSSHLRTTVNLLPSRRFLDPDLLSFFGWFLRRFVAFGWRLFVLGVLVLASFCFPPRRRAEAGLGRWRRRHWFWAGYCCGSVFLGLGKAARSIFLGLGWVKLRRSWVFLGLGKAVGATAGTVSVAARVSGFGFWFLCIQFDHYCCLLGGGLQAETYLP